MACQIISCCGQSVIPSTIVTPPPGSQTCNCDPTVISIYAGFFVVASIAAAIALPTSTNNRGLLYNGSLTGGDGGGSALYGWDGVSTAAHNGGSVLQPSDQMSDPLTPGRWIQTPAP